MEALSPDAPEALAHVCHSAILIFISFSMISSNISELPREHMEPLGSETSMSSSTVNGIVFRTCTVPNRMNSLVGGGATVRTPCLLCTQETEQQLRSTCLVQLPWSQWSQWSSQWIQSPKEMAAPTALAALAKTGRACGSCWRSMRRADCCWTCPSKNR